MKELRLAEIISLMRDHRKNLNYRIYNELTDFKVSQKTFLRDIEYLRDQRGVPITYDPNEKVFYLSRPYFDTSFLHDGNPQLAIIGTKLAETILPEPLKGDLGRSSAAAVLEMQEGADTINDYNFFVSAFDQLVEYDKQVVETVFKSCMSCHHLEMEYCGGDGKTRMQVFSPHFMVERQGKWYLRGELHISNGITLKTPRIIALALHRIKTAKMLESGFTRNKKIKEKILREGLFDFETISNVKLYCAPAIRQAVREQNGHHDNEIIENADGSILLTLKSASKHQIIKWVFAEQGKLKVIEPASLSQEICEIAQKILSIHSGENL